MRMVSRMGLDKCIFFNIYDDALLRNLTLRDCLVAHYQYCTNYGTFNIFGTNIYFNALKGRYVDNALEMNHYKSKVRLDLVITILNRR